MIKKAWLIKWNQYGEYSGTDEMIFPGDTHLEALAYWDKRIYTGLDKYDNPQQTIISVELIGKVYLD